MGKEDLGDEVIRDFGAEWSRFKYLRDSDKSTLALQASLYLSPIRDFLESNKQKIIIADFGGGTGRWSEFLLPYASCLIVVEPSDGAFQTLKERFRDRGDVILMNQKIEDCEITDESLDLAVSLGVIHHIPDPLNALKSIHAKLKTNGQFLGYLYYDFENRGLAFRNLWRLTNYLRTLISKLPNRMKFMVCDLIALVAYFPLARVARLFDLLDIQVKDIPLSQYRNLTFEVMRNDALDRFGTRLEQRFSRDDIRTLLKEAGFNHETIVFSENEPFWTFSAQKN